MREYVVPELERLRNKMSRERSRFLLELKHESHCKALGRDRVKRPKRRRARAKANPYDLIVHELGKTAPPLTREELTANTEILRTMLEEAHDGGHPLVLEVEGLIQAEFLNLGGLPHLSVVGLGANKTIICNHTTGQNPVHTDGREWFEYVSYFDSTIGSNVITPKWGQKMPSVRDALYHYQWNWGDEPSFNAMYRVTRTTAKGEVFLDRPVEASPADTWMWTCGRECVPDGVSAGVDRITLADEKDAKAFKVGQKVWLTDGKAINECRGEHVELAAVEGATLIFIRPLRQSYKPGLTSAIPGPFSDGLSFYDIGFGNAAHANQVHGYFRNTPGLQMERVRCARFWSPQPVGGGGFSVAACTDVKVRNCDFEGSLSFNTTWDVVVRELSARTRMPDQWGYTGGFGFEELVHNTVLSDCPDLGGYRAGTMPGAGHVISNVNVAASGWGIGLADRTFASQLRLTQTRQNPWGNAWILNSPKVSLVNCESDCNLFVRGHDVNIVGGYYPRITMEDMPPGYPGHGNPSYGTAVLAHDTPYIDTTPKGNWTVTGGWRM